MPTLHKRKTNIGLFDENTMRKAVNDVLNGGSLRKVAKYYDLSHQTFSRYVKKQKENANEDIRMTPNYEVNRIFSIDHEKILVDYIIKCSKMFYGLPTIECRKLAYEMATTNRIKIPESWEKNKAAGVDWMKGFRNRHSILSLRTAEGCSLSRATSFNRHNVGLFFDKLYELVQRSENFKDGTRIYNLDETGTSTVQNSAKVFAEKGIKQVCKVTSGERGVLVTTCCIINAAGNSLPPVMIFPRVHFKLHMIKGAPTGTLGLATPSGWMNSQLFVEVMKHFIKYSGSSKDNQSILIYDNHESHLSLEATTIAKDNGVNILTIPPHSSNKLQPLDIGIYKPFNLAYNSVVDSWLMQNPGNPISIFEVANCVGQAHQKAMTPTKIINSFKKTGIFPFDRDVFSELDFLPSSVTDRPDPVIIEPGSLIVEEPESIPIESVPATTASGSTVGPAEFKGYPKAGERKSTGKKRRKGKSCILTDTPEKNEIEKKFLAKQEKNSNEISRKRRLQFPSRDEKRNKKTKCAAICNNMGDLHSSSGSSDISWSEIINDPPSGLEELQRDPMEGDFVLVEYEMKKNKVYYIGKVERVTVNAENNDEYDINFLRKSLKLIEKFHYPIELDQSVVDKRSIKMILPIPSIMKGTKRQQAYMKFEVNFSSLNIR